MYQLLNIKILNSSYLSNCDLINKYSLNSLKKKPKLKKITLELSSHDILNSFESLRKNEADFDVRVNSFVVLYVFYSFLPYIKFVKGDGTSFLLKISLFDLDDIHFFLVNFFIENWENLVLEDFSFLGKYTYFSKYPNSFVIQHSIPLFFELDDFLAKNSFGIIPKNLNFKSKFLFQIQNFKNKVMAEKRIKNIPPFWING